MTCPNPSTSLKCEGAESGDENHMAAPPMVSNVSPPEIKIKFQLPQQVECEEKASLTASVHTEHSDLVIHHSDPNPEGSIIKDLLLKQRIMPPVSKMYAVATPPQPATPGSGTVVCEGCNVGFEEKEQLEMHKQHLCPMSQNQAGLSVVEETAETPGSMVIVMNEDGSHEPAIITEVAKEVELTSSTTPEDKKKPDTQTNVILEVVDPKLPPKRGRPKGSRNRPKDSPQLSVKLPSLNVTKAQQLNVLGSGLPSTPLSGTPMTPDTPSSQSLLKLKLKGKLLMKRSMSVERMLSQDKEKMEQLSREANSPNMASPMPETLGLNPRKQHPGLLQRSHSVDAIGLRKKPKLIREYSLQEDNYDPSPNITILPGPAVDAHGVSTNHALNPPHEIVVLDEHNNTTEVIVVQQREEVEGGCRVPINEAVQNMCYSLPMFAPNIHMKDQSVRLPPVLNIPASLAQKIPGLIQPQNGDSSKLQLKSFGSMDEPEPMEIDEEVMERESKVPAPTEDNGSPAKSDAALGDPNLPTHHAVNLTGISKLLQEKVLVALLLLGHNYPSMGEHRLWHVL